MPCDPHDASLGEFFSGLVPFAALFIVIAATALGLSGIKRQRPNISFCVSVAMIAGFLLHPAIGLAIASYQSEASLTVSTALIGVLLLAAYSWLASPLLIGLGVWSWHARGRQRFAAPAAILAIGLATNWWTLNDWTNSCGFGG
jgi:hypothetical protein